jgi:hypothetical protein
MSAASRSIHDASDSPRSGSTTNANLRGNTESRTGSRSIQLFDHPRPDGSRVIVLAANDTIGSCFLTPSFR